MMWLRLDFKGGGVNPKRQAAQDPWYLYDGTILSNRNIHYNYTCAI